MVFFALDKALNLCYGVPKAIAFCSHFGQVAFSLEQSVGFFYVIHLEPATALYLLLDPHSKRVHPVYALDEIDRSSVHIVVTPNNRRNYHEAL